MNFKSITLYRLNTLNQSACNVFINNPHPASQLSCLDNDQISDHAITYSWAWQLKIWVLDLYLVKLTIEVINTHTF